VPQHLNKTIVERAVVPQPAKAASIATDIQTN
jgi:hypothetical protein